MSVSSLSEAVMAETGQIYVGIGSNVDREKNINGGIRELAKTFGPLVVSSVYESESFGFSGDNFYNLVAGFQSDHSLAEVMERLREIEFQFGRQRNEEKYSSRTLDIDLLLYGDMVEDDETLVLPRPDIKEYSFVLCPLAEIAPDRQHPVSGESFAELWKNFSGDRDNLWKSEFQPESNTD